VGVAVAPIVATSAVITRADSYTALIRKTLAPVGAGKIAAAPILAAAPVAAYGYSGLGLGLGGAYAKYGYGAYGW
ncbi:hypothetical protein BIW11_02822, partial [Tropilaelaps mercedesae]